MSVLLLGGDGSITREGVRTDSVMLLVIDTASGRSVMFSLPRNMMRARFPEGSPLHEVFPDGYTDAYDPAGAMLNAIYGQVPVRYPGILGDSDNDGAPDLYVTTLEGGRVLRNDGGRFADVTTECNARASDGWLTPK